ncbi:hypothetical protein EON63_12750 [archaeon]|nr:MAG: hypothetical protein EON63_12750 [archaeon]
MKAVKPPKFWKPPSSPPLHASLQVNTPSQLINSEDQLLQDLTTKAIEIIDLSSTPSLSALAIQTWQEKVHKLATELRATYNKKVLMTVYASLLSNTIGVQQDALQATTVDILNGALLDGLLTPLGGARVGEIELTELIDELTDMQLGIVEKLPALIEKKNPGRYVMLY